MASKGWRRCPRRHCAGIGLVEVLVAITISSMGLLALARLHVGALRQAKLTQHRAVAMMLAGDIADLMRANPTGGYTLARSFADQASLPTAPSPSCTAPTDTCTATQLSDADLHSWRVRVRDLLPAGSAFLSPAGATAQGAYDLWVAWRDPAVQAADELVRTGGARECHNNLLLATEAGVRCIYVRLQL